MRHRGILFDYLVGAAEQREQVESPYAGSGNEGVIPGPLSLRSIFRIFVLRGSGHGQSVENEIRAVLGQP
jgi:hypothetical protein